MAEAYAIVDHKPIVTVARTLVDEWVSRFGVMQILHTDQVSEFESKVFQAMCNMFGVNKTRTTPCHPQSDGLVDRCNRTLKDMLSKVINENQDDWDEWFPHVLLAYRTAVHSTKGITPHRMLFGREARIPVHLLVEKNPLWETIATDIPSYVYRTKDKLQRAHETARKKSGKAVQCYKDYYHNKAN